MLEKQTADARAFDRSAAPQFHRRVLIKRLPWWTLGSVVLALAVGTTVYGQTPSPNKTPTVCDAGNGGLSLPEGFCASIFADNLGRARHLTVASNGDVYVNTWSSTYTELKNAPGGYIVALRDKDHDARADQIERFGSVHEDGSAGGGTGIAVNRGSLFVEDNGKIVRYKLGGNRLVPAGKPVTVLRGLWTEKGHIMHPFAITADGVMYINSGSITNSCQEQDRTVESPGKDPCPELALHAGIWRYDTSRTNQTFSASGRFATGTRNIVALALNPRGQLYATFHGRDQLNPHWPKLYTKEQNNELPGEIFAKIERGDDFGWPYCYYDPVKRKHVLAPEYGGDGGNKQERCAQKKLPEYGGDGGNKQGRCAQKKLPDLSFPAHWAPNGMAFYNGVTFPANYRGGAFVVFHGSHDRKPTQSGFQMVFVPFKAGKPSGNYQEFATGFSGTAPLSAPTEAAHRPMAVAVGPDGALYVSDDVKGRIWKITYVGNKVMAGKKH